MKNLTEFFLFSNNSSSWSSWFSNKQQATKGSGLFITSFCTLAALELDSGANGESYEFQKSRSPTKSSIKEWGHFLFHTKDHKMPLFSSSKTDSKMLFKKFDFLFTFYSRSYRPGGPSYLPGVVTNWLFSTFQIFSQYKIWHFWRKYST